MVDAMYLLRSSLSRVRIPEPTTRIYKQECCVSFDTLRSEGGLFVDINSFLAFGKDYVGWNYEKTGNPVYLHIKQTRKVVSEDRPSRNLLFWLLGGFDNHEPDYEEIYSIVILPDFAALGFPSVRLAVDAILMSEGAERKEQLASWTADKKQVSAYATNLRQIDNGIVVPPSGWRCAKCDKTENLWLNLTDGMILCGRRNWDGTGGNNHAVEHYQETDVFSYVEDESVLDPLLAQHLAFFGIDFSSLQKTEMTTAERELDQNTNFDWNRIQESGQEIEPLFGPGYTGLVNLGNSCYLASVMQLVFSTHSFCSRYYKNQSLKMAFECAPADPTVDLNMQLTKLAHGLLSGRYSVQALDRQEGIRPRMFKAVIAASHPEFSTMRQQSSSYIFLTKLNDVLLETLTWIHQEVSSLVLRSVYNVLLGRATVVVRPRVPIEACLASFSALEEVHDFYSSALKAKTTAIKTAGLTSFPDYLVLHMRKFVMEEGWVPKKLDVYIDVPDMIDISHMRSKGIQPGEELLPETAGDEMEPKQFITDDGIVAQLVSIGFSKLHREKVAINTLNAGVEEAMNWLLPHMDDPDLDAPISHEAQTSSVDQSKVDTLVSFGFQEDIARKALKALEVISLDIEKATDWIFSNSSASGTSDMDAVASTASTIDDALPDGGGRYRLIGFVSHIGTSTQCGHYVAHIHKEGRWVIFNDDKGGASVDPPKDMGYLENKHTVQDSTGEKQGLINK
ncbi:Ubiquitinyl hydrolase, variant UBP zinc finger, partial [Dillenia turbinata]